MSMEQTSRALIEAGEANCVCCAGEEIVFQSKDAGIRPLLQLAESDCAGRVTFVADKVIGKAAAGILAYLGAPRVYGALMSKGALEFLEKNSIQAEYGILTKTIQNRTGDGLCPMEALALPLSGGEEIYRAVLARVAR